MPKFNVSPVDLFALQELAEAVSALGDDWLYFGANTPGNILGNKIKISTIGSVIATQIGTAINRPDRVYQIGGDMPVGASVVNDGFGFPTIIEDPYLDGLDFSIHLRSIEYLIKGQEWQNDIVGGGFRYTDGRIFEDGQVITASFKPEISSVISTPDAVARFLDQSGIYTVTATQTLTAAARRKLVFIQGATAVISVTLDDEYPEGVLCAIRTANGAQKQCTILAPAGQQIYLDGLGDRFYAGQSEYYQLVRYGNIWYMLNSYDAWYRSMEEWRGGIAGANKIYWNGQTLQANEYPRLDARLQLINAVLPGSIITPGAWPANKTQWARDGSIIIVPKLGGLFARNLDTTLGAAGYDLSRIGVGTNNVLNSIQQYQNAAHNHDPGNGFNKVLQINGTGTAINGDNDPGMTQPNLFGAANIASSGGDSYSPESRPINYATSGGFYI